MKVPLGELLADDGEERMANWPAWIEDVDECLRLEQNRVENAEREHGERVRSSSAIVSG